MHSLAAVTATVSCIVYLALATGQGICWKHVTVPEAHEHVPNTSQDIYRQVLWLRYVNWFLTWPMILTNLALLSGLPGAHLFAAVVAEFVMLGAGLLGTFDGYTDRRWVWFAISCVGYLTVIHHMGFHGQRAARDRGSEAKKLFGTLVLAMLLVKALYPM